MLFTKCFSTSPRWVGLLSLAVILSAGCSRGTGDSGKRYMMGEAAKVGPLTYSVIESEWKETLDGAMGQRLPQHRFLLVNLSIANHGESEVSVPLLTLVGEKDAEFRELDNAEGVSPWLGYLRRVAPSETLNGKILFDVPPGGYKLRISSGGQADTETTAVVELPYRADAPPMRSVDPVAVPSTK